MVGLLTTATVARGPSRATDNSRPAHRQQQQRRTQRRSPSGTHMRAHRERDAVRATTEVRLCVCLPRKARWTAEPRTLRDITTGRTRACIEGQPDSRRRKCTRPNPLKPAIRPDWRWGWRRWRLGIRAPARATPPYCWVCSPSLLTTPKTSHASKMNGI